MPAFNEQDTIGKVIDNAKNHIEKIVVVDDGSIDKTFEIASKCNKVIVIKNEINKGYDFSLGKGFEIAIKNNADIIVSFDADGQHDSDDIDRIVKPILINKADLVVGKRPYRARFTEHLFSCYSKKKIGVDDPLCGLKAYSAEVYKKIGYFDKINSIGTQLMFNAIENGFRLEQIDISLNKRKDTPRFGRMLVANYKIFMAMLRIIFKRK
ncbi:MAG: glycosyltransferase family 2 protein [archaeon]